MEICNRLTLGSAGGIFWGQEAIWKVPKTKALILWSLSLCVLPSSLFTPRISSMSSRKEDTASMLERPASAWPVMMTYTLTPDGNAEGFFMELETYQRRMLSLCL